MTGLSIDPPVESGNVTMATEHASPQAKGVDTATVTNETTSGQSGEYHEKGTISVTDTEISSPENKCDELSGDEKDANDIPTAEGADSGNVDKLAGAVEDGLQMDTEPKPKKKKKKKSKKKGGAARKNVTGFEEFYADAPMTPAEAAEEKKEIYTPSRAFSDRIEECIQRYRASRRMDSERTMIFNKYLWLGGIDSSQRQFTGFAEDREAIAEADRDAIRQMTARDFVGGSGARFYDHTESEHWFVDFEGIVKGFLSRTIPEIYLYDEPANRLAAETIKNFLNYVLMHDVCPEHVDGITAARSICDIAPIELCVIRELYHTLPGAFNNIACSLYCDRQVDKCHEDDTYGKLVTFRVTVLCSALNPDVKKKLMSSDDPTATCVVDTKEETYEVVDIIKPRQKDIRLVEQQLEEVGHAGKGKPAGIIVLKPSIIEFGFANVSRADEINLANAETEQYLLEDELLAKFEKGMKIQAIVCELNIGLRFIKEVKDVRVSFDLFLPQMLMENWKEPIPNDRPPPSALDPNAEEKAMAAAVDD